MSDGNSHTTLSETYALVDQTRKEVNSRIDDLGSKFDAFVTSNEHRLTVLETHQGAQAQQIINIIARQDDHGEDIGKIKDRLRDDEATERALSDEKKSRWTTRTTLITVAASITIALVSVLAIFHI